MTTPPPEDGEVSACNSPGQVLWVVCVHIRYSIDLHEVLARDIAPAVTPLLANPREDQTRPAIAKRQQTVYKHAFHTLRAVRPQAPVRTAFSVQRGLLHRHCKRVCSPSIRPAKDFNMLIRCLQRWMSRSYTSAPFLHMR